MGKETIISWIETYERIQNELDKQSSLMGDEIKLCSVRYESIHVYKGLNKLASILGCKEVESKIVEYEDGSSNIEYYFDYDCKRFFQLGNDDEK